MSQPASTKKNNLKRSRYPISVSVLRQPFAMVIFFIATLNISKTTANKTDTYNYSTKYEAPCNNLISVVIQYLKLSVKHLQAVTILQHSFPPQNLLSKKYYFPVVKSIHTHLTQIGNRQTMLFWGAVEKIPQMNPCPCQPCFSMQTFSSV